MPYHNVECVGACLCVTLLVCILAYVLYPYHTAGAGTLARILLGKKRASYMLVSTHTHHSLCLGAQAGIDLARQEACQPVSDHLIT